MQPKICTGSINYSWRRVYWASGRVGSPGTVRKDWFETEEEAITARQTLYDAKQKKGYQTVL
jgi:predicted DNA-binding WGR domain protein